MTHPIISFGFLLDRSNVVFKAVDLPDGIAPSSANIINSQNEYLIHILQVLKLFICE